MGTTTRAAARAERSEEEPAPFKGGPSERSPAPAEGRQGAHEGPTPEAATGAKRGAEQALEPGTSEAPPPPKRTQASEGSAAGGTPKEQSAGAAESQEVQAGAAKAEGAAEGPTVLEEGKVQFFCRPKVGKDEVSSLADVQRFFMLLRPAKPGAKSRLCVLGKKRLPSARRHERFFGFVQAVSDDPAALLEGLGERSYETKTRGTRHLAAARVLGQGTFAIVEHHDHTKLLYKLQVPATPGEAQLEFTIGEEGAFVLTVKNPGRQFAQDPGLGEHAQYPPEKQAEFEDYRWIPARDTQLLDVERCEFLLVGAREELPPGVGQHMEEAAEGGSESEGEEGLLAALKDEMQVEHLDMTPAETGQLA